MFAYIPRRTLQYGHLLRARGIRLGFYERSSLTKRRPGQVILRRVSLMSHQLVYHPEDCVEDFERYHPGGFHPTYIGDEFVGGRYRIVHKLGYGGYSTVWLARDRQENRYVALKIITAQDSTKTKEKQILMHLQSGDANLPGRGTICLLLDSFSFHGPNGKHFCLVTEPAGCSIAESKANSPNLMFPLDSARSITAQIVMGLDYLHSNNVCHGDLHAGNILLQVPNFDSMSVEEIYKQFGEPFRVPISRVDKAPLGPETPSYAVIPMNSTIPANKVTSPQIQISDFGTSFMMDDVESATLNTPTILLPPEAFFNEKITPAADVWTLGLTLYEIIGERPLFEVWADDPDNIIGEMVSTLGRLPSRWWEKWEKRKEFFLDDGSWNPDFQRIQTPVFRRLDRRLWDMGRGETAETSELKVNQGEMECLESLLRGMLRYEPAERMTAREVIQSPYMDKWALPAWQKQISRYLE